MPSLKWVSLLSLVVLLGSAAWADQEKAFQEIGKMDVKELTLRTREVFEKKYAGEDWAKFQFPKYVYTSLAVQMGYRIAVKEPQLLAKFPCYCFCDEMGHKNLAYCFLKNGVVGKFDDHASTCNICYTQAMKAFLWNEMGAKEDGMQKAFKEIYGK